MLDGVQSPRKRKTKKGNITSKNIDGPPYQAELQEYYASIVYQRGQMTFEKDMNPFMKTNLKAHFPSSDEYERKKKQIDALEENDELRK